MQIIRKLLSHRPGTMSDIKAHGLDPGADIAWSLARHNIDAEGHTTKAPDIEEGKAILSRLLDSGSDLLVMGASV